MTRTTETQYFDPEVKPAVDGVYKVKHDIWWGGTRFSLWKNSQWHFASSSPDIAERETMRSILLYERGFEGWCGVIEKPEWA
jgi:hypothetical protein